MYKERISLQIAKQAIYHTIDSLHTIFLRGQAITSHIFRIQDKIKILDDNNPEFKEMYEDHVSNLNTKLYAFMVIITVCIDYLLLNSSLRVLCAQSHLPKLIQTVVPFVLVIGEIIISYFTIIKLRRGEMSKGLALTLQFFVVGILIGATLLSIVYSVASYNADVDTSAFGFFSGTIIYQLILLVSAILLHIWMIKNAESIVLAFAYLKYRIQKRGLLRKIHRSERENKNKNWIKFKRGVCKLMKGIEDFRRHFPEDRVDFTTVMTKDFIEAVNLAMGRTVLLPPGNIGNTEPNVV